MGQAKLTSLQLWKEPGVRDLQLCGLARLTK